MARSFFRPADDYEHARANRGHDVPDYCKYCRRPHLEHTNGQCPPSPDEQPGFTYWECKECGFDAVTRDPIPRSPLCPLCAGDTGRDVEMTGRVARIDDKVEGKDARK